MGWECQCISGQVSSVPHAIISPILDENETRVRGGEMCGCGDHVVNEHEKKDSEIRLSPPEELR